MKMHESLELLLNTSPEELVRHFR